MVHYTRDKILKITLNIKEHKAENVVSKLSAIDSLNS